MREFNIHDLVRVRVESSAPAIEQIAMHHWREFEIPISANKVDVVIKDYSQFAAIAKPWFADGVQIGEYAFQVEKLRSAVDLNKDTGQITVYADRGLPIPLNLLVQLSVQTKGYSLIHGAGVQYRGKNILIPAYGGVGKTILVSEVISRKGKMFGDDMVLVGNGEARSYPLDLSVYEYHLPLLGINNPSISSEFKRDRLLDKGISLMGRVDSRLSRVMQYLMRGLKRNCFSLPVREVLGPGVIIPNGKIDAICFFIRRDIAGSDIVTETVSSEKIAEMCASVLAHEWAPSVYSWFYPVSSMSELTSIDFMSQVKKILAKSFEKTPCSLVTIPANMLPEEYSKKIMFALDAIVAK